jgi:hypothetical protein
MYIKAKCLTLFLNRCIQLFQRDATLTAEWITLWNRTVAAGIPPNIRSIPADFKYLWLFSIDLLRPFIYLFRRWEGPGLYAHLSLVGQDLPLTRILAKYPKAELEAICENIASTPMSDETISTCYRVIHHLTPKHVRLNTMNLQNTRARVQCHGIDTLLHRLTTCTATSGLWQWARHTIVVVLPTDPRYVPPQWLVLPGVTMRPKTKCHTTI